MKKIICILLLAVTVLSCSKEESVPQMTVKNKELVLFHDETETLVVENAKDIVTYTPENKFIAKVSSDGIVTGGVRGETNILVLSANETVSVKVTVATLINFIPEPYLKFGQSFDAVKNELDKNGEVTVSDGNLIQMYTIDGEECPYIYLFENGKMVSCGFMIETLSKTTGSIVEFLLERYIVVARNGTYSYVFVTPDEKIGVNLATSDNLNYLIILYFPVTETKSSTQINIDGINRISRYAIN